MTLMTLFEVPWCWVDDRTCTLYVDILDWLAQHVPGHKLIEPNQTNYFIIDFPTEADLLRFKLSQSRPIVLDTQVDMYKMLVVTMSGDLRRAIDAEILATISLGFSS